MQTMFIDGGIFLIPTVTVLLYCAYFGLNITENTSDFSQFKLFSLESNCS